MRLFLVLAMVLLTARALQAAEKREAAQLALGTAHLVAGRCPQS